jgi:hypothetical protein
MDIAGPLPVTKQRNKYILVICDHFTKWVKYYALKDMTASTVAKYLVDFILNFGIPEQILTDQGTNFMSQLINEIYDVLDIQRTRTTPYHAQCDGLSERTIQTMKEMIRHFIDLDQKNWDTLLDKLAFAYNTSVHATTGKTPFELEMGCKAKVPVDLFFNSLDTDGRDELLKECHKNGWANPEELVIELNTDLYAWKMQHDLRTAYEITNSNRATKTTAMRIRYDRHVRAANFDIGDQVLLRDTATTIGVNKKLTPKFKGPYKIIGKLDNNVSYILKGNGPRGRKMTIHTNRLKKWFGALPVTLDPPIKYKNTQINFTNTKQASKMQSRD